MPGALNGCLTPLAPSTLPGDSNTGVSASRANVGHAAENRLTIIANLAQALALAAPCGNPGSETCYIRSVSRTMDHSMAVATKRSKIAGWIELQNATLEARDWH